jgi:amino acid adenylation domain-containing protein
MNINLLQYFEQTVVRNPNKVAIKEGTNSLDFKSLQLKAKGVAAFIKSKTNRRFNSPIAVFLPKSIDCITADMAATYSGNAYMNLDVKAPTNRIFNIISLIEPAVIITRTEFIATLPKISSDILVIDLNVVDYSNPEASTDMLTDLMDHIIDTDPYCIINTSGSTGTPKGVVLNHKSFFDFTDWSIETFQFNEDEIIGSLSPQVFDIYSFELCLLITKGSTIVLIPDGLAAFPVKIIELLQRERATFLFWVPTIMVNIANMNLLSNVELPDLRIVWFAGEVFPTKQFNYWKKQLGHTKFVNLYGPIEITLDCTYFVVDRDVPDDEPLPIGIPCRNTSVLVLNDEDKPIGKDEEGELCIRGTSLAMGYYNNPEKTAAAFVQNPLNKSYPEIIYRTGDVVSFNDRGEIVFKGRKDTLIKHLGYRIELGEIEHVIVNVLQMVKNCCAVYHTAKKEITTIYESHEDIADGVFRIRLLEHFPKYMIPSKYIRMDELPRNTNGKIDRLTLKNSVNEN